MRRAGRSRNGRAGSRSGPEGLLRHIGREGYPFEYLLSRVRGRRSRLIRDWRTLALEAAPLDYLGSAQYQGFIRDRSAGGLWRSLLKEHGWVYGQLDGRGRTILAPYFLYAELKTIFVCLRFLQGEKEERPGEMLAASLLADDIKEVLAKGAAADSVKDLERALVRWSSRFGGLSALYADKGLRGLEHELARRLIVVVLQSALHPVVQGFFRRIADARNILALFKAVHARSDRTDAYIQGGALAVERLQQLQERADPFAVIGLVREASGIAIADPGPTQVEVALYRGISKYLRAAGRDPLDVALVLEYLWRCSLEVTNLSLLLAGKDLPRETIAAELVS